MRILQINKNFFNSGGSDAVFFETIDGLRQKNHQVIEFSSLHPNNKFSIYSQYFISSIPNRLTAKHSLGTSWKIVKRLFYSREVEQKLTQLVKDTQPDIAHIHNAYHHLSISTFLTLSQLGIPTVLTLHDYFPLCPNHNFLYKERGSKDLFQNKIYNCIRYKCINNQLGPSIVGTFESYYYRLRNVWNNIDQFICPSNFMKQTMVEGGFTEKKLKVIFNPFKLSSESINLGSSIVFLGRIHYEKGIKIFLEAVRSLKQYKVVIAGNGPEDRWVDQFINQHNLTHVKKYSWVEGKEWLDIIKYARVMVFPTIAYENCSRGILEALSFGRLIVASDRGGNSEMVINDQTGFLVKPEDAKDLARVIRKSFELPETKAREMVKEGRDLISKKYSLEQYIFNLEKIYHEVLNIR